MRVVVLHESPGADAPARAFSEAARDFNRGLDIRLRFLEVGFEIREVEVENGAAPPAVRLAATLERFRPGVVLVLGRGPALLECAAVAAKAGIPLAVHLDGELDRAARAVARLAQIVIWRGEGEHPPLGPGAECSAIGEGPAGPRLVEVLVRLVKEGRGP